jgi:hypothetical protein
MTIFASNGNRNGVCWDLVTIVVAHALHLSEISFVIIDAFRATLHRLRSLEYVDEDATTSRENECIVSREAH